MMRKDKDYLGIIIDGKWLREFSLFFLGSVSQSVSEASLT